MKKTIGIILIIIGFLSFVILLTGGGYYNDDIHLEDMTFIEAAGIILLIFISICIVIALIAVGIHLISE